MQIETRLISDLKPAKYNPRKPLKKGDDVWVKIENSIATFGMVEPVVINMYPGREHVVIGGHQRLKVLKSLGFTEVDCSVMYCDEPAEMALNLALNKIGNEFDRGGLRDMFEFLNSGIIPDITVTGFDIDEIQMLFTAAPPPEIEGETSGSGEGEGSGKYHICPSCGEHVKCEKSKKG
jgi:hypothetical protein